VRRLRRRVGEVVGLLRWATAETAGDPELETGTWWRLAAGCADLLRRLPDLNDEIDEVWTPSDDAGADDDVVGPARVERAAGRLAALLRSARPTPLGTLATAVDALGAAAVSAVAVRTRWPVPSTP
jgi:hypothetical protein